MDIVTEVLESKYKWVIKEGVNYQKIRVCLVRTGVEYWDIVWRGVHIAGLVTPSGAYFPSDDISLSRALFFRGTEQGKQERVEFRVANGSISGDIRRNVTLWYFDDWELIDMLSVDE